MSKYEVHTECAVDPAEDVSYLCRRTDNGPVRLTESELDDVQVSLAHIGDLEARVVELESRTTNCPECGKAQVGRLKVLRSHPPSARCQHCGFAALTRSRGVDMLRPDQPEEKPKDA